MGVYSGKVNIRAPDRDTEEAKKRQREERGVAICLKQLVRLTISGLFSEYAAIESQQKYGGS